jgi:hypothetical protein
MDLGYKNEKNLPVLDGKYKVQKVAVTSKYIIGRRCVKLKINGCVSFPKR